MARVLGPKGLSGAVRIEVLTDWPERLAPGAELWVEGDDAPMHVTALESGGRVPVLHLEEVRDRDAAQALGGRYLEAVSTPLGAGAYFWDDLIGLRVETPGGDYVGRLEEIFRAGGNEVYRVLGPDGERLVPALASVVRHIDVAAGVMVVADDEAEEVR